MQDKLASCSSPFYLSKDQWTAELYFSPACFRIIFAVTGLISPG
nr:MAG TPA: protein of unknown function (DUF5510) [Caudoviricetes sp.]